MEKNSKIGSVEALAVLLIVPITHLLVTLPKIIFQDQGSSSILNILYVTLLGILAIFILTTLYKNFKGMDILDICDYLIGNWFKFIIGIIYIIYIIFIASLILRNISENLKTIYFNSTPLSYILFFFLLGVGFINKYDLKSIIKCNLIMFFITIIAFFTLSILSINKFIPERIFPILGHGASNTFLSGASNIFVFGHIILLFFIMPLLKDYNKFNKISYTSIILAGLFIIITIGSLLLMFPLDISSNSNSPTYLQARQITLGKFIQRVDAFFVLIWIGTTLSYLTIIIAFINSIFKKVTNIQNKTIPSYCFTSILFGISLFYENTIQVRKLDLRVYKISSLILVFVFSFLILILANIKKKIKGENKLHE